MALEEDFPRLVEKINVNYFIPNSTFCSWQSKLFHTFRLISIAILGSSSKLSELRLVAEEKLAEVVSSL